MPYTFPTQSMITKLADSHAYDKERFQTLDLLPVDGDSFNQSPALVSWDVIAPTKGLTAVSDFDAEPNLIDQRAITTKQAAPLVFRDAIKIGEKQLIQMRRPGSSVERDGDGMIYRAVNQLNNRIDSLVEATAFMAFSGSMTMGGTTVDYGIPAANKPNVATSTGYAGEYWDDADADIRKDINKAMECFRGKGVSRVIMLADWSVYALMSRNAKFIQGFYGSPNAGEIGSNKLVSLLPDFLGCGISEARMSSEAYIDDNGNSVPFAPGNKMFLVGLPAEGELGAWASTPNTYNGGKGGRFLVIDDHSADRSVPYVNVIGGIMGIPVLYRPDCVVCMQVLAS